MFAKLAEFFNAGGIWMYPIVAVSIAVWAIGIERIYSLFFRYNINAEQLMAQIQKLVLANNIDRAIKLCNAAPSAALPRVIKAALTRANKGEEEIASALEEANVEVLRGLQKRVPLLPTLANTATLCGLLGTIVALIEAFTAVASAPPDMKSQMLTAALAIGLNATALGLTVAIPALVLYMFLFSASKKIIEDIDQYSLKIQNLLVARGKSPNMPNQFSNPGS
ncbi:MAG: MotA/TolQ/ExbB proton channel family protein [Deltaproteobacteria bacterium]|nr:MotA/TolQ/ExbB proton channel family protein [Deltaproteobacteria bacterium]